MCVLININKKGKKSGIGGKSRDRQVGAILVYISSSKTARVM